MRPKRIIILLLLGFAGCTSPADEGAGSGSEAAYGKLWTTVDKAFILAELERTTLAIKNETVNLTDKQAAFTADTATWSITEILEHLEVQNELHFREIRAISKTPQLLQYVEVVKGWDKHFQNYATDTVKGKSQWFLEPIGRFSTKTEAIVAFLRVRGYFIAFIETTEIDLRKHFTFRRNLELVAPNDIVAGDVRDLHQLLLTGIAHTDRHLAQIRRIKQHKNFPKAE